MSENIKWDMLRKAYQFFLTIPSENVRLFTWITEYPHLNETLGVTLEPESNDTLSCGTMACAVGWLVQKEEFRRDWIIKVERSSMYYNTTTSFIPPSRIKDVGLHANMRGIPDGFDFANDLFGFDFYNYYSKRLFGVRSASKYDKHMNKNSSDKEILLNRIEQFFKDHDQLLHVETTVNDLVNVDNFINSLKV